MRDTDIDNAWCQDTPVPQRPPAVRAPVLGESAVFSDAGLQARGKRRRLAAGTGVPPAMRARGFLCWPEVGAAAYRRWRQGMARARTRTA